MGTLRFSSGADGEVPTLLVDTDVVEVDVLTVSTWGV